ncbi:MAG: tetratricopeptide repeat protein, partial [Flavitalea sp.]
YLRRATDLDPLTPGYRAWLAWWYWAEKRYEEGIAEAKRVLDISPDFPLANMVLGGLYATTGKFDEGIALTRKAAEANPRLIWALGIAYIKAGKLAEAKAMLAKMEKTPFHAFSLAIIYAELGDFDEALKWVKVVKEIRHTFTPWLTTGFFAEPLKNDPRLKDILKTIIDSIPRS